MKEVIQTSQGICVGLAVILWVPGCLGMVQKVPEARSQFTKAGKSSSVLFDDSFIREHFQEIKTMSIILNFFWEFHMMFFWSQSDSFPKIFPDSLPFHYPFSSYPHSVLYKPLSCTNIFFLDVLKLTKSIVLEETDYFYKQLNFLITFLSWGGITCPNSLSMLEFILAWFWKGLVHAKVTAVSSHVFIP